MGFIFTILLSIFISCQEPILPIKTAGKMMKQTGLYTTYNKSLKSNIIYTLAVFNNTIYLGTDQGFHISLDAGKTFTLLEIPKADGSGNFNHKEINVTKLAIKDSGASYKLYIATNKGLYYREGDDGNIEFKDIDAQGNSLELFTVYIDSKNNILVGTSGKGLYVSPDNFATWINYVGKNIKRYKGLLDLSYEKYQEKAASDPNFVEEAGVIKIEPFYFGDMKSTSVSAIFEYQGYLYCGTVGGGISYTKAPATYTATWKPYWKTYISSWYFFDANYEQDYKWKIWSNRNYEADWTLRDRYVTNISANSAGLFVSTKNGLAFTSHGERYGDKDILIDAPDLDNFGRKQEICDNKNQYVQKVDMDVDGNDYSPIRADNWDTHDDVLRINQSTKIKHLPIVRIWEEYYTGGIDVAKFKDAKAIQVVDEDNALLTLKLESNVVNDVKLGTINNGESYIIYAGTGSGLSVAELRTRYDRAGVKYVMTKVKDNWITYHNILALIEKTVVKEIFIVKDSKGDDSKIYVATHGMGLLVFEWPAN